MGSRSSAARFLAYAGFAIGAAASACSLLTSVDGLATGSEAQADGGSEAETGPRGDGNAGDGGGAGDASDAQAADTPSRRYANAVLADRPLGYWRLEETMLGAAKDETGGHDGAYAGAPLLGEPGVAGSKAMKLPVGSQSRVGVPSPAFRFPGNAPYSVELWVRVGILANYGALASGEVTQNFTSRSGWTILVDDQGLVHYEVYVVDDAGTKQVRGVNATSTALTAAAGAFRQVEPPRLRT